MSKISTHLVEIRFIPDSRVLDKRGQVADQLSNEIFNHWNISSNRIDFTSSENPELSAFFSFRNIGVTSNYPNTTHDFKTIASDFIKTAWPHFNTKSIIRIGVRSAYLVKTESIAKAFEAYKQKFLKLNNNDLKTFGGDLVDVGFPLNFVEGEIFYNIMTGPMGKEQSQAVFKDPKVIPEAGIYVEVDYFKKEFSPHIIAKHAIEFLENGLIKADSIVDQIADWINKPN